MKRLRQPIPTFIIAVSMVLVSCAGVRNTGNKPAATAQTSSPGKTWKFSPPPKLPDFSLASLLPGSRVKVVQVRIKDLKKLPTGRERALAFENERKRGFWFFGGPVDFKEPTLPEPGSQLDGSLLPPRIP
jgi:hypothetical protein